MKGKKIIITGDGSQTIFSEKFNSLYHSSYGAMQESQHIFINNGIRYYYKKNTSALIKILEYGFGTGLNALLSLDFSIRNNISIEYTGLEAFPLSLKEAKMLNYADTLNQEKIKAGFLSMHKHDDISELQISSQFQFSKIKIKFEQFTTKERYDIIFYDVFGADIQAELWLRPHLDKVIHLMKNQGILITYGAKGSFKRALKSLNMEVQSIPGPPGKREITRAIYKG